MADDDRPGRVEPGGEGTAVEVGERGTDIEHQIGTLDAVADFGFEEQAVINPDMVIRGSSWKRRPARFQQRWAPL
jgi:hypothetical protein